MNPGERRFRRRTHPLSLSKLRQAGQPLIAESRKKLQKLEKVGPLYHLAGRVSTIKFYRIQIFQ